MTSFPSVPCSQSMADNTTMAGDARWILPSGMIGILIQRLNSTYAKTNNVVDNCSRTVLEKYKKTEIISMTMQIMENVWNFKQTLTDLETTLNDYSVINSNHEEVTKKIVQKMTDVTKVELQKCFPQPNQNEKVPKKQIVSNEQQVLIINDINKKDIKEDKSFSEALKENLSNKLEGIPVSKSTLTREGKAVLMFPNPESCTQAKASLQKDYDVENSDRKPTIIQPRIKIHNLDPSLTEYNKGKLQAMITSKNESLKEATDHEFEITFIDSKQNFAIAKVSPDIHKKLINNGRVYIDLWSNKVSNHFNPIQCFQCQNFNHTSTSSVCIAKDKPNESTCLYCSKNHKSSNCPSKKDKKAHKCANCIKSKNLSIKKGAVTHASTSKTCPIYIQEVEKLKLNTCYDQQEFMAWSSRNPRKLPSFPVNSIQKPEQINLNAVSNLNKCFIESC